MLGHYATLSYREVFPCKARLIVPTALSTSVEVTTRNSSFIANQTPLQLMVPTRITIRNEDPIRHNFSSRVLADVTIGGPNGI